MATKPLIVNAECHSGDVTVLVRGTTSNYATTKRPDVERMYDIDGESFYGTIEQAMSRGLDVAHRNAGARP